MTAPAEPAAQLEAEQARQAPVVEHITSLTSWRDSLRARVRKKYDVLVIITGAPGVGKSHLEYYLGTLLDPTFTWRRMVYSGEVLIRTCESLPPYSVVGWDEIVEGGLSIEAVTGENRRVLKHFITGRSLRQIVIACAPELALFQRFIKEGRAHWWIHIPQRGVAVFHEIVKENPYPGGKPFYAKRFVRTNLPKMPADIEAAYEQAKEDWRTRWHRDSKRYIKAMNARDQEAHAVAQLVKSLNWLPGAVRKYEDTFQPTKGKTKAHELDIQKRLEARVKARRVA